MSRAIFEDVLGKRDVRGIWGAGFPKALAVIPQNFVLGAILPAVLYMMRFGNRRGRGKFVGTFGEDATVNDIAAKLVAECSELDGFVSSADKSVLADLLLAYCFENKSHRSGRTHEVRRVFPTHYFSSWVDLPMIEAHLRGVPEMLTAILSKQERGPSIVPANDGNYPIGDAFNKNKLLKLFGDGTSVVGELHNLRSDVFSEEVPVGIDQLLAVRVAEVVGEAPTKATTDNGAIPNQLPIAGRATKALFEDFDVFVRSFGSSLPRQSLVPLIESGLAVGLTNIFTSSLKILLEWSKDGRIPPLDEQRPWELFVDCSASSDDKLRRYSEESVDDLLQKLGRVSLICMCQRILNQRAEQERLAGIPHSGPDPTDRLNFLGDILFERNEGAAGIRRGINRDCNRLEEALQECDEQQATEILSRSDIHPAMRLAEATVYLMGEKQQGDVFRKYLDSVLMIDQPNGLARKRRTLVKGKSVERRSIVLNNTVLDFLVHRHLKKSAESSGFRRLSLDQFSTTLKTRYGLYIDDSPPGRSVPDEQLRRNRGFLERRLRDLGLFVGVNDAEAMKRLRGPLRPTYH